MKFCEGDVGNEVLHAKPVLKGRWIFVIEALWKGRGRGKEEQEARHQKGGAQCQGWTRIHEREGFEVNRAEKGLF